MTLDLESKIPVYCIYDARAHSPLALGMMMAYAKSYAGGRLRASFNFLSQTLSSKRQVEAAFRRHGPGIYLFSDYMWTLGQNVALSEYAKQLSDDSFTIHGGPSAPAYPDACQAFFERYPHVDVVVRGEGEGTVAELLDLLSQHRASPDLSFLEAVAGLTYRRSPGTNDLVRTPDRQRSADPNQFPSPYLSDHFDRGEIASWSAAIVETNRGCPYGCTFCDWGSATLQKVRQFSLERIYKEIEWVAVNRVPILWIADANFGILKRDVNISEFISRTNQKYGFPKQVVVNYAKHSTVRLAEIIRNFASAGLASVGIISIQTQDPQSLDIIRRSNIKTKRYEELIGIFRRERLPISSDLMIGLPGATIDAFKSDLQFFFDRQVAAWAYATKLLPNSPMAHPDYVKKFDIRVDSEDCIISTFSFTRTDLRKMHLIFDVYRTVYTRAILKHFLYYLQVDHGIAALDFIDNLVDDFVDWRSGGDGEASDVEWRGDRWRLNEIRRRRDALAREIVRLAIRMEKNRPVSRQEWRRLYDAVARYTSRRYGIERSSSMEVVLEAQQAIMPSPERVFPEHIRLAHDVVAYFEQIRDAANMEAAMERRPAPLEAFPPGELVVTDPTGICEAPRWNDDRFYDLHVCDWELGSALLMANRVGASRAA